MDAPLSVGEAIRRAAGMGLAGNYRGMVELVLPLLRAKEKLSLEEECFVVGC